MSAVKNDNLEMAEWLHECCPSVLPYLAMIEAAKTGNLRMLQWLAGRHESSPWLPEMMDAAASTGQVDVLQWLHEHLRNVGCTTEALSFAVKGGHLDAVKWFGSHRTYPGKCGFRTFSLLISVDTLQS